MDIENGKNVKKFNLKPFKNFRNQKSIRGAKLALLIEKTKLTEQNPFLHRSHVTRSTFAGASSGRSSISMLCIFRRWLFMKYSARKMQKI